MTAWQGQLFGKTKDNYKVSSLKQAINIRIIVITANIADNIN